MRRIWFHGTNEANVQPILAEGFKEGTYFARDIHDALAFGGPFIFEVIVDFGSLSKDDWQVCAANRIGQEQIVGVAEYFVVAGAVTATKAKTLMDMSEKRERLLEGVAK